MFCRAQMIMSVCFGCAIWMCVSVRMRICAQFAYQCDRYIVAWSVRISITETVLIALAFGAFERVSEQVHIKWIGHREIVGRECRMDWELIDSKDF